MKWLDQAWWNGLETIIGLECPIDPNGSYRLLHLSKDQHRIKVLKHQEIIGLEATKEALDKHSRAPIVIALSGDFIMERLLPIDDVDNSVSAVLGVGVEDSGEFDSLNFAGSENRFLSALIRNDAITACTERFDSHENRVITAIFSKAVCGYLLPQVKPDFFETNSSLILNDKTYFFVNGGLAEQQDLSNSNYEELNTGKIAAIIAVPESFVFVYASLMYVWLKAGDSKNQMPIDEKWKAYLNLSRLKQIAIMASVVLGIWFIGLFSMRMQAERQKTELELHYSQNLPVLNAIQQLDEKIEAREALGTKLGAQTLKPSKVSYYLDQVAVLVPTSVRLLEVIVGPNEEDFKRQGVDATDPFEIIIRGESSTSAPIAQYSKALEGIKGLQSITVSKSEKNFQSGKYEFVFLLRNINKKTEGQLDS